MIVTMCDQGARGSLALLIFHEQKTLFRFALWSCTARLNTRPATLLERSKEGLNGQQMEVAGVEGRKVGFQTW